MPLNPFLQTAQSSPQLGPHLAVVETTLRAGQMTPLHVHRADETIQVLHGAVTVFTGATTIRLSAGEPLALPGGEPHAVRADTHGTRIRTGSFVMSVSRYEDFLRAIAAPGPLTAEDEATLAALGYVNGIRILGAPGELPAAAAAA